VIVADPADTQPPAVWVDCALCWGQRVIWREVEGRWQAQTCECCLGIGQVTEAQA